MQIRLLKGRATTSTVLVCVERAVEGSVVGKDCSDGVEQAPPFIRSMLSWQAAMAIQGSSPCPCVLPLGIDPEQAATDPGTACEWASALARLAKNFEENIAEAKPTSEEDRAVVRKWLAVLGALREAHRHAEAHIADFGTSRVPMVFVRSLRCWEIAMMGASAYPTSFGLVAGVDLEKAAVDLDHAQEWIDFLAATAERITRLRIDAERLGESCPLINWEGMLNAIRDAHDEAEEHVASLGGALPQEEIIAERRLSVVGDPARTVTISICRPRPDIGGDWICRVYIDGMDRSPVKRAERGSDSLGAMSGAVGAARFILERTGLTLQWGDLEPGNIGLSPAIPCGLGIAFMREMEEHIAKTYRERVIAAGGEACLLPTA